MAGVVLICPLCGTDAAAGAEPAPGACPGCGAAVAGGGESAPEGVRMALAHWDLGTLDPLAVATALFETEPAGAPAPTAAITSDRRDGFYLWWVFVREGEGGVAGVLRGLIDPA